MKGIDESLTAHDFRLVDGQDSCNLIFDVVAPFSYKNAAEIPGKINEYMQIFYPYCRCVINIDRTYEKTK
jgi:hypothetical protein